MMSKVSCNELLMRANSALVRRRRSTAPEYIDFMILLSGPRWHVDGDGQTHSKMRSVIGKPQCISHLTRRNKHHAEQVVKAFDRANRERGTTTRHAHGKECVSPLARMEIARARELRRRDH
jgi:hypothetical protein